jgi:hypothetical protein
LNGKMGLSQAMPGVCRTSLKDTYNTMPCTAIHSICQHEVLCYQVWRKCHDVRHLMSKSKENYGYLWQMMLCNLKTRKIYLMKVQ